LTFDTQGSIDGLREGYQTSRWADGAPNWWDYTERQYGMTRGLPRVLDILDDHGVTATFPTCGLTAEWYPDRVAAIADRGHEVANHTYSHRLLYGLDRETEREEILAAGDALAEVTGREPAGFRCPVYSTSADTLSLLAEAGYAWESSFHNHDRPYHLTDGEDRLLELPVHLDDWTLFLMETRQGGSMGGYPRGTPAGVGSVLEAELDRLHAEGQAGAVRVFTPVMHPKIIGRPHRATVLDGLIEHAAAKPGVEFLTCSEVAAMC
ncbi:MAG: polysaccharide deacetylase family protein, partial [Halobacteriaceae archaeon]